MPMATKATALNFCQIAPRQNGACALIGRRFRDQLAGVTGRPVDQDRSIQVAEPPRPILSR